MTAVADVLLDSIKQYAQSLKKQMGIPLSKAQELAARAHSFADWHELTKVAERCPHDPRLRAAAVCARSGPGLLVPPTIQVLQNVAQRLADAADIGLQTAIDFDADARDLRGVSSLRPVDHFALGRDLSASTPGVLNSGTFRLNLFDPKARFVCVSGCAGWGKSAFAVGVAGVHYAGGGAVLYLDPLFSPPANERDKPAQLLGGLLEKTDVEVVDACDLASSPSRARFTVVRSAGERAPDEFLCVLEHAATWLRPLSIVVIDEGHLPQAFSESPTGALRLAAAIDVLIAAEISVVLVSMEPVVEDLPVSPATEEGMVVLLGRRNHVPTVQPIPSPKRKRSRDFTVQDVLDMPAPPRPPTDGESLARLSSELAMSRGDHTSWICATTAPDGEFLAFIARQAWSEIEAPFKGLSVVSRNA